MLQHRKLITMTSEVINKRFNKFSVNLRTCINYRFHYCFPQIFCSHAWNEIITVIDEPRETFVMRTFPQVLRPHCNNCKCVFVRLYEGFQNKINEFFCCCLRMSWYCLLYTSDAADE